MFVASRLCSQPLIPPCFLSSSSFSFHFSLSLSFFSFFSFFFRFRQNVQKSQKLIAAARDQLVAVVASASLAEPRNDDPQAVKPFEPLINSILLPVGPPREIERVSRQTVCALRRKPKK
jgi:hypothetical protein